MTNELPNQAVANQLVAAHNLPRLSTVKNLPGCFPLLGLTSAAIHGHIFKAQDRFDSKGRKIPGNGLAASGAIIRRGRRVLIDLDRYAAWLAGTQVAERIKAE
jgi:hypothetical protein